MNNNIVIPNIKEKVFLDTAFLASFSIPNHKDFSKAQKLLSELVLKYEMHTSPLCFYELWEVIKKYNDYYRGNKRFLRKFNRILKFIHIKIRFEEINFSYKQVIKQLKRASDKIVNSKFIDVTQLKNTDIKIALDVIDKFDQKPGDAFHFSSMKNLGINTVITGNKKDFKKMGFKIIWF